MRFALTVVDASNAVVALELDAPDDAAARDAARQRGYAVLVLRRKGLRTPVSDRFDTVLFSIELLALLDAGLNVVEALQTLAEKQLKGESRRILGELLAALQRGESLSQAVDH